MGRLLSRDSQQTLKSATHGLYEADQLVASVSKSSLGLVCFFCETEDKLHELS